MEIHQINIEERLRNQVEASRIKASLRSQTKNFAPTNILQNITSAEGKIPELSPTINRERSVNFFEALNNTIDPRIVQKEAYYVMQHNVAIKQARLL